MMHMIQADELENGAFVQNAKLLARESSLHVLELGTIVSAQNRMIASIPSGMEAICRSSVMCREEV